MPHARIDGHRIYYEISGRGPPLVLIRGLARSLRYWEPFADYLRPHFRILAYDHRGIGRSSAAAGAFGIAELARDLADLMKSVFAERAHVFGLSLGGMVAQRLAHEHVGRVDRLILGATWCGPRWGLRPRIGTMARIAAAGAFLRGTPAARSMASAICTPEFARESAEVVELWRHNAALDPPSLLVIARQAWAAWRHEMGEEMERLDLPALVVTGDADALIPHQNSLILAGRIPGARLEVLPGVGHDLTAQAPRAMADLVRRFLTPGGRR